MHMLHTHQAERAAERMKSRRSACRASLLMRLSSDVWRSREELPARGRTATASLADRRSRPPGGKPRTVPCSPGLVRPVGAVGAALGSRAGLRDAFYTAK